MPGVTTIEANAREYVPAANKSWESKFPGIFVIKDGTIETANLNKPGLSAVNGGANYESRIGIAPSAKDVEKGSR